MSKGTIEKNLLEILSRPKLRSKREPKSTSICCGVLYMRLRRVLLELYLFYWLFGRNKNKIISQDIHCTFFDLQNHYICTIQSQKRTRGERRGEGGEERKRSLRYRRNVISCEKSCHISPGSEFTWYSCTCGQSQTANQKQLHNVHDLCGCH